MLNYGVVSDFGGKAQTPLGANHQVQDNIDRVFEIDERIEAVSGSVFNFEFLMDACCQL